MFIPCLKPVLNRAILSPHILAHKYLGPSHETMSFNLSFCLLANGDS
jgi:hypothetical protein